MKSFYKFIVIILFTSLACGSVQLIDNNKGTVTNTPLLGSSNVESAKSIEEVDIANATIIYYDISGNTENELRQQLDKLSPRGYDNFKGDATTNWRINWTWDGYGNSNCDLTSAEVTYSIEVTMPRWESPQDASPELITKWNNYIQALTEHEKGHVDFVVENYMSVETAIKNATCDTAESAAQAALLPIRQYDIDYDAETNHGATQGARFP